MPTTEKCPRCNGEGGFESLVSMHDDKKEYVVCTKCHGSGVIHQMTDEEERDYHDNYW